MNIRISIQGDLSSLDKGLNNFPSKAAQIIRQRMRERLGEPKSGRLYKRRGGQGFSRSHRASAQGESPATDTGAYDRSLKITKGDAFGAAIETNLNYPAILETKLNRPLWQPSVNDVLPELEKMLAEMLQK